MIITSIYQLRDNLSEYLNQVVENKDKLIVYRYKKPIVVIQPPSEDDLIDDDVESYFGFLEKDKEIGIQVEDRLRRNKKEKEYVKKLQKRTC